MSNDNEKYSDIRQFISKYIPEMMYMWYIYKRNENLKFASYQIYTESISIYGLLKKNSLMIATLCI